MLTKVIYHHDDSGSHQRFSRKNHRVHYTIPPKEFMRAERYAAENNLEIIGFFIHIRIIRPDLPGVIWKMHCLKCLNFITSVHQNQALVTRSWRLNETERKFEEETIEINYIKK